MITTRSSLRRAAALAAVCSTLSAAVLSGCSSSAGSAHPSPTVAGAAHLSSLAPATAPSSSTSSSPSLSAPTHGSGLGGLGGGGFCSAAKAAEKVQGSAVGQLTSDSPAALQKFEKQAIGELQTFVSIAPSAIRSDVAVLAAASQKLYAQLEAAHFDYTKVDQAALSALAGPQFSQAAQHVEDYLSKNCGITPTS